MTENKQAWIFDTGKGANCIRAALKDHDLTHLDGIQLLQQSLLLFCEHANNTDSYEKIIQSMEGQGSVEDKARCEICRRGVLLCVKINQKLRESLDG